MEQASDEGFACTSCTPYVPKPVGKSQNFGLKDNLAKSVVSKICTGCCNVLLSVFLMLSSRLLPLFTVVESAIMASIKIKEPGEWPFPVLV